MIVVDLTGKDDGTAIELERIVPCHKRTWCFLHRDHGGSCIEYVRHPLPPPDYGPKRKARS